MTVVPPDRAELLEVRRELLATRAELLKMQIVAATRQDVIRLLGTLANRDPVPDVSELLPRHAHVRAALAIELRELATHMRECAQGYDDMARALDSGSDGACE